MCNACLRRNAWDLYLRPFVLHSEIVLRCETCWVRCPALTKPQGDFYCEAATDSTTYMSFKTSPTKQLLSKFTNFTVTLTLHLLLWTVFNKTDRSCNTWLVSPLKHFGWLPFKHTLPLRVARPSKKFLSVVSVDLFFMQIRHLKSTNASTKTHALRHDRRLLPNLLVSNANKWTTSEWSLGEIWLLEERVSVSFFFYSKPINFLQINQDDFNLINTQPINTCKPWINRITCISWNKLNNKYTASFMYLLLGY